MTFLSTLPARGATIWRCHNDFLAIISIHAPREGSDNNCTSYYGVWS